MCCVYVYACCAINTLFLGSFKSIFSDFDPYTHKMFAHLIEESKQTNKFSDRKSSEFFFDHCYMDTIKN